jgi:hypothetical protein
MAAFGRLADLYRDGPGGGIFDFRNKLSKMPSVVRLGANNRHVAG